MGGDSEHGTSKEKKKILVGKIPSAYGQNEDSKGEVRVKTVRIKRRRVAPTS